MVALAAIKAYAAEIALRFQPRRIILFGSHAWGTPDAGSDVDLLVVMSHEGSPVSKAVEIRCALDHPGFALDLIVHDPDVLRWRLENEDWFLRDIAGRGVVLYEAADARVA